MSGSLSVRAEGRPRFKIEAIDFESDPQELFAQLSSILNVPGHLITIKFGFPKKNTITLDTEAPSLKSLGLSTNELIIVETPPNSSMPGNQENPVQKKDQEEEAKKEKGQSIMKPIEDQKTEASSSSCEEPQIPDEKGLIMIQRQIPSDNSCLFNAISLAFCGSFQMGTEFRKIVSTRIKEDPVRFNPAILEKSNAAYAEWILKPTSWGGEPEMIILSEELDTQIAAVSVQHGQLALFGSGAQRIYLLHDGIHFDLITRNVFAEAPSETDIRQFKSDDKYAEMGAMHIAKDLKGKKKFTDLQSFAIECVNCKTKLKGQEEALSHYNETGHKDFTQLDK